jgi:hypothetical protein
MSIFKRRHEGAGHSNGSDTPPDESVQASSSDLEKRRPAAADAGAPQVKTGTVERPPQGVTSRPQPERGGGGDALAEDLMRRVAKAIDDWRVDNSLSAVPREIAFEQAIGILNAAYKSHRTSGAPVEPKG